MNLASGGRSSPFSWHNATKFAQLRHRSGLQGRVVRAPSPPSMLAPLHGSGVARVVAAGLHRYIRRRKAQLSMLGIGAATLAVMLPQCGWTFAQDAADQLAQRPPEVTLEAWVATLLAANALRVAACAALCFGAARHMDARQERADEVAGLLASRQDALHRFAAAVLGRSRAPNLEGEPDTATAFREWFLAQMAASDALLHQLRVGEDSTAAASHLQAAMERLGLTAAELARMRDGELAGGSQQSGVARALSGQRRIEGRWRPRPPSRIAAHNEAMQRERARLERLVRLTTRGDHAAAFREYVAEMEAHLERCMQEQEDSPGSEGPEPPCAPDSPLSAFDEGDCQRGTADPEGIDWGSLAAEWERLDREWSQQGEQEAQGAREAAGGSGPDSDDGFCADSE